MALTIKHVLVLYRGKKIDAEVVELVDTPS